jgi:hypothetical protein
MNEKGKSSLYCANAKSFVLSHLRRSLVLWYLYRKTTDQPDIFPSRGLAFGSVEAIVSIAAVCRPCKRIRHIRNYQQELVVFSVLLDRGVFVEPHGAVAIVLTRTVAVLLL